MEPSELEGRLFAIELVLATISAGAARVNPGMLDLMHELLSDRIRDGVSGIAAQHQDVPEAEQMAFVEASCNALDHIITTARALS